MIQLILFVLLTPTTLGFGVWHYLGYFNGRYDRWDAQAQDARQARLAAQRQAIR